MTVGEKIKACRKNQKITQEHLAEKMNVTRQAVSKWENGTALPNMENLIELAKIFQVPLSELTSTKEEAQEAKEESENKTEDNEIEGNSIEEKKEEEIEREKEKEKENEEKTSQGCRFPKWILAGVVAGTVIVSMIFFIWKEGTSVEPEATMAGGTDAEKSLSNASAKDDSVEEKKITFTEYTGYLDACMECYERRKFTGVDYDKDGLVDRVYRSYGEVENAYGNNVVYTIEFGNGEILKLGEEFSENGFLNILSSDLTGDGKTDIIFEESYISTDPQSCGAVAVYARKEKGYVHLEMPHYAKEDFHMSSYENYIPFTYEKAGAYNLLVKCEELGYETEIKIDRDCWNGNHYDDSLIGNNLYQCIYDVFVKELSDGSNELTGKVRLIDKWHLDEAYVAIQYQKGELIYKEMYQQEIDKTPDRLLINDGTGLSSIEVKDGKTGKDYVVPKEKWKEFMEMLSKTEWIEQEASGGIVDIEYKIKEVYAEGYIDELIFQSEYIMIYNGSCWEIAGGPIPFSDYMEEKK